jgi:hypothetical protein
VVRTRVIVRNTDVTMRATTPLQPELSSVHAIGGTGEQLC